MSVIRSFALTVFMGTLAVPAASHAEGMPNATSASPPNRTLPTVDPPRTELAFPAQPEPQDIFRTHVFEEPLVPVGGHPSGAENAALAAALLGYSKRSGPDDFSSLTAFLEKYPASPWRAALLTDLALEYYNTAHYSLALDAWGKAWALGKDATDPRGKAIADRAVGELAYMYARLGRMSELEALFKSVEKRGFMGAATERITGAREGLWTMQNRPGIAFRCGPLALQRIKKSLNPQASVDLEIFNCASTQKGFSLPQVAELSRKIGLNYQMAFREGKGAFIVPSVVHWKVGHYAALVRQQGDLYLLQDPTFGNEVWATRQALEAETSGYFLIPPGALGAGWRQVQTSEGETVWGKGNTSFNDAWRIAVNDLQTSDQVCGGMPRPGVHLMLANLNLADEPVGYSPPVGPSVPFVVRYNQRDASQPANFTYSNFGYKWTCDWISYITDNPSNVLADVNCYMRGGGVRTFTGFDPGTQTYAYQGFDQTLLKRTGPSSYEMLWGDGSKLEFSQSDGSVGTSRKVFLTQVLDPAGNAATLTYDEHLRLVAITDAIGQVTTLTYGSPDDIYKITQVTDPFGRSAIFGYEQVGGGPNPFIRLVRITNEMGLTSHFLYNDIVNGPQLFFISFIKKLTAPYGDTFFNSDDTGLGSSGNTRFVEITYPDSSRERVEFNQTVPIPDSDPVASLPAEMATYNSFLRNRNTYYWDRNVCATAYGDYSKARLYHWLHTPDLSTSSGDLESTKAPLEGRVWFNYGGQGPLPVIEGTNNRPTHVGRVLDDGSTQLYRFTYDGFGHVLKTVDPVGRTLSYIYATNGIDLLEVRQTRATNELLAKITYNAQHLPLNLTDAAGQTTACAYNPRGQVLSITNPKHETFTCVYDANGYLLAVDGPLPGTNDVSTMTYDAFGRVRTATDVSGYTLTLDYDSLDWLTRITYPDSSFEQITYDRLDPVVFRDRAGRQTLFNYDRLRQLTQITDPLGRATRLEWCRCGAMKSLTDPLGRTTSWLTDVQGRRIGQRYSDGSQVTYSYENAISRLRQVVGEKQESTLYTYNSDDTLKSIVYANAAVPTPGVTFTYDPDYERITSVTDGIGITTYSYNPITDIPVLGAGRLESVAGPLSNEVITYSYDELGRRVSTSINGVAAAFSYDQLWRVVSITNALGSFTYGYDGNSRRLASESYPNGMSLALSYGGSLQDFRIQQIAYAVGATPLSQFNYGWDISRRRITTWSQQVGAQSPNVNSFGYDDAGQLLSAAVTNSGSRISTYSYTYDPAGNRLSEQVGANSYTATYNTLNQISTTSAPGSSRTNEWDAADRLVAVNSGNRRTEFTYDGDSRIVGIRQLVNGSEVSRRQFVWSGLALCEERNAAGAVTKRFFGQGMKVESGPNAGRYFYTGDHLGSIRELTDGSGTVRARYTYDPWGRRTRLAGDMDTDFGFAGMFWSVEGDLSLTHFRAYDPELGRWLARDPLRNAEVMEGPNLYAYAANDPVNLVDPLGLAAGEIILRPRGDIMVRPRGDIMLRPRGGELIKWEPREETLKLNEEDQLLNYLDNELRPNQLRELSSRPPLREIPIPEPAPRIPRRASPPRLSPGFSGALSEFIGAGITVLTMTDCNTVNGILGLVRQGKGGLLNVYEDQMMKQIDQFP